MSTSEFSKVNYFLKSEAELKPQLLIAADSAEAVVAQENMARLASAVSQSNAGGDGCSEELIEAETHSSFVDSSMFLG